MENINRFKVGDCVVHDKFGAGKVSDIDFNKGMYTVYFCDTGVHRVMFTTNMTPRENLDYHCLKIEVNDTIRIQYLQKFNISKEFEEPFSVERFNELANCDSIEFEGCKYVLDRYFGSYKEEYAKIISQRFLTMHYREEYIYSVFLFEEESLAKKRYEEFGDIIYKPKLFKGQERNIEAFVEAVEKKYGVKPVIR